MQRFTALFGRWLQHRHLPLHLALLAMLLCTGSLGLGLQIDDYYLRFVLSDPPVDPAWSRSPAMAFAFMNGDVEFNRSSIYAGALPWWTAEELRLAFFRPLSGVTHWLDFRLWPDLPWIMHLHSLLWFGAAVGAAAVAFRRLIPAAGVAGLAGLLFAIDDAHATPAMWIANRNATIGVAFGMVALIAHDAWRRNGSRTGMVLAPAAFAAALLASESAAAIGAFLLGYALFLDRASWSSRLTSLLPGAAVGGAWWAVYSGLGFGAKGSIMYIDPLASPAAFLAALVERIPLLIMGHWTLPADLYMLLSERAGQVLWLFACGVVLAVALLVAPLVKRSAAARFFAFSMVLSLVPVCATVASNRLLFFAGFGGMGLLAMVLAGLWQRSEWVPNRLWWKAPALVLAAVLAISHILLAPLVLSQSHTTLRSFNAVFERAANSLPADASMGDKTVVIATTPSYFITAYGPLMQLAKGRQVPRHLFVLGSSIGPIHISRPDPTTLVVAPEGGYLAPAGVARPGHDEPPPFDPGYMFAIFDRLYRSTAMQVGQEIELAAMTARIAAVTETGRPQSVAFRFSGQLDDPSLVWLRWLDGAYVPWQPPAVGESLLLPEPTVPFF